MLQPETNEILLYYVCQNVLLGLLFQPKDLKTLALLNQAKLTVIKCYTKKPIKISQQNINSINKVTKSHF